MTVTNYGEQAMDGNNHKFIVKLSVSLAYILSNHVTHIDTGYAGVQRNDLEKLCGGSPVTLNCMTLTNYEEQAMDGDNHKFIIKLSVSLASILSNHVTHIHTGYAGVQRNDLEKLCGGLAITLNCMTQSNCSEYAINSYKYKFVIQLLGSLA